MMNRKIKFLIAITAQIIIILIIIVFKLSILTGGTSVMLKIAPVDPRDMLRGDYLTFQYDISRIDSSYLYGKTIKNGDTVYVYLWPNGKYWSAQGIQTSKPLDEDQVFIKGYVASGAPDSRSSLMPEFGSAASMINVVYGVEQYFIPEGQGLNFNFAGKEAAAQVMIDSDGNPVLKQVYVNDKLWP